jgi:hypothetical protein
MTFKEMVKEELASARVKYSDQRSFHEGYAVILEELDEFWDEVKRYPRTHNTTTMLRELVQIGAMAQRTAEDAGLISREDDPC